MRVLEKYRRCNICEKRKLASNFHKAASLKDGFTYYCKQCKRNYDRQRFKLNGNKLMEDAIKYTCDNPWIRTFVLIGQRCNNANDTGYKWYGKKNVKRLITSDEVKKLWFRDKAYSMKRPSIQRIDPKQDYKFSNCAFIELSENARLSRLYCKHCQGLCKLED